MEPRWVHPVFEGMFPSGSCWNRGVGYLEIEKLGATLDSLMKLGAILVLRDCEGMKTLEKHEPFGWSKIKLILYLFAGTEGKLFKSSQSPVRIRWARMPVLLAIFLKKIETLSGRQLYTPNSEITTMIFYLQCSTLHKK